MSALLSPTKQEAAAEAYRAAYRGRDVASVRALQTMRCGLNETQRWVMDCLVGKGLSASEIVGGNASTAEKVERHLAEALDRLAGVR